MRCDWNLAKKHCGCALEYFQGDAIGICLRHNLKFSQNVFDEMRLEFAKTKIGIVLEHFR